MTLNYKLLTWSIAVKKLDDYTCRGCGSFKFLESHHIIPISHDSTLKYELDNGITLCLICHNEVHDKIKPSEAYLKSRYPQYYDLSELESRANRIDRDKEISRSISEYNHKYYRDNKDTIKRRIKLTQKDYYKNNIDRIKMENEIYRKLHREGIIEYNHVYYGENKHTLNVKSQIYYKDHKKEISVKDKEDRKNNPDKYKKKYRNRVEKNPESIKNSDIKYKKTHRELLRMKSKEYNKLHSADIQKRRSVKMEYLRENDFEEYERIRERHNYLRRERRSKLK